MAIKIEKKIVKYEVQKPAEAAAAKAAEKAAADRAAAAANPAEEVTRDRNGRMAKVIRMHEKVERPEVLIGSTYKIKTPISDHAMYVTINDIVLNEGTDYEQRRPFEIFINSKNLDHFQWIVALTRIISAVFRKGGDVTFLVDELRSVFDPRGGYFKKGGKYMPSLVGEIGDVIESHLKFIGMIESRGDERSAAYIAQKREEYAARTAESSSEEEGAFPKESLFCSHCNTKAVIIMDGCLTCLNCGDSKCG